MKIINTCETGKLEPCFSEKVNEFKTSELEFMGTKDWGTNVEAFVLQNGTTALIKYNKNCQSPGIAAKGSELRNCIAITYDTNGLKKPNQVGKDIGGNASFLIVLSHGLKMTAGDIQFAPEGGNYWLGAKIACENLGMQLPKMGNGVSASGKWDRCDSSKGNSSYPVLPAENEACQISSWCSTNTCSPRYWLAEVISGGARVLDTEVFDVGGNVQTTSHYSARCVE